MSTYHYPELADISLRGAKLRGASLPPPGTKALLRAGELEVLCEVKWVKEGHCGICFEEPVHPAILKQVQLDGSAALDCFAPAAPPSGKGQSVAFSEQ
jgi:hypothetical protein